MDEVMNDITRSIEGARRVADTYNSSHHSITEAIGSVSAACGYGLNLLKSKQSNIIKLLKEIDQRVVMDVPSSTKEKIIELLRDCGITVSETSEYVELLNKLKETLKLYDARIKQLSEFFGGFALISSSVLCIENYFRDNNMFDNSKNENLKDLKTRILQNTQGVGVSTLSRVQTHWVIKEEVHDILGPIRNERDSLLVNRGRSAALFGSVCIVLVFFRNDMSEKAQVMTWVAGGLLGANMLYTTNLLFKMKDVLEKADALESLVNRATGHIRELRD